MSKKRQRDTEQPAANAPAHLAATLGQQTSHVKNKLVRAELYGKLKHKQKKQKRAERKKRQAEAARAEELGLEPPPKKQQKTLESTRENDVTMVDEGDEEIHLDEADDEFAAHFARHREPKVLITTCYKPSKIMYACLTEMLTLESTRENDVTMVDEGDEEIHLDEADDEFAGGCIAICCCRLPQETGVQLWRLSLAVVLYMVHLWALSQRNILVCKLGLLGTLTLVWHSGNSMASKGVEELVTEEEEEKAHDGFGGLSHFSWGQACRAGLDEGNGNHCTVLAVQAEAYMRGAFTIGKCC
eukprot:GHRR01027922.1.p1 GENE.GHRR01027922.1~~GHRR01027922.1.p1  ORF type:complete len:300 (+),score=67.61 GHRR01027922.1:367-1266(+)